MILVVTNSKDATADFVEPALRKNGKEYFRLNTDLLADGAVTWKLDSKRVQLEHVVSGQRISYEKVSSVWFRRPIPPKIASTGDQGWNEFILRESSRLWGSCLRQLPSNVRWVNHPDKNRSTNFKPEQLCRAREHGLQIPPTLITTSPDAAYHFFVEMGGDVIVKPLSYGRVESSVGGESGVIYCNVVEEHHLKELMRVRSCPVLLQQLVRKKSDLRVTIVGDDVHAVQVHSQEQPQSRIDFRRNNMTGLKYSLVTLPETTRDQLLKLVRSYGLWFAAIDLVESIAGELIFLEINANGQWAWLEQEMGVTITKSLIKVLSE